MVSRYLTLRSDSSYLILGPRQTGKTNYIRKLHQDAWYINLLLTSEFLKYSKDPSLFRAEALLKLQNKQNTIIVDEVQKIPAILDEVHSLIEEFPGSRFILTGSSARKLKKSSVNLLAGRALSKRMYPFIVPEIIREIENPGANIEPNIIPSNRPSNRIDELLHFGSLPGVFGKDSELKREILKTYVDTYLKEEIQAEGITRNLPQFARFLDVAAQSFTEILNYTKIGKSCGQSPKTTQNYFDILEDTLIGFRLMGWSESKRKQLASHPKFYFFDNGVTCALLSRLLDPLDPSLRGRLFEQWILNEVRARVDYDRRDIQLYSWRLDRGQAEVDLLVARGKEPLFAAEIKSFSRPTNEHFDGLRALREDYPNLPLYLICTAEHPYKLELAKMSDSVLITPWRNFLLEELPKY